MIVSFICDDKGRILAGESLADGVRDVSALNPDGFSINCVSPRHAALALATLRSVTDLPIAVYANVGHPGSQGSDDTMRLDVTEDEYAALAAEWLKIGASIIGGCCGTTPAYIARLREILPRRHEGTKGFLK